MMMRSLVSIDEAVNYISNNQPDMFSAEQKENIQRLMGAVTEEFETITGCYILKKKIVEYWDGGACCIASYNPVWSNAENGYVRIGQNEYGVLDGDTLLTIFDTETDEEITDYVVDPDTGIIQFEGYKSQGFRRYKLSYTTGYYQDSTEVSDEWKQMALMLISYWYSSDLASYTQAVDGIAIYPRQFPPAVKSFLQMKTDRRV